MPAITDCTRSANVWTHENRISSDSNVKDVCIPGLFEGAIEATGILAKVDGRTKLNGVFKYEPFQPGKKVTTDGFDQIMLYYNIHSIQTYLMHLGFNIPGALGKKHDGVTHPIVAHANATPDLNAWYSPQSDDLTFGTNRDKWHIASDNDVSSHEGGHLILDHYNPALSNWSSGEGRAIHEGYSDALAACYTDDPEISEDFVPHGGGAENKNKGLRTIDNELTLEDDIHEEHARGQVYGAFFWSIKKALQNPEGPFKLSNRDAADLTLRLIMNHGTNYVTNRPKPKDFVDAVVRGMEALASEGKLGVDINEFARVIIAEATRRKMLVADIKEPEVRFTSVEAVEQHLSQIGSNVKFYRSHESDFIGGSFEIYQEQVVTQKFGPIDVIGRGINIQRDRTGRIVSLSIRDVAPFRPTQIDESGNVGLTRAIQVALNHANNKYRLVNMRLNFLQFRGRNVPVTELAKVQMEHQIARSDLQNLQRMIQTITKGTTPKYRIVMIDGSTVPHYEFKVGLSIYYISTKDEKVTWYKDIIVN